MSTYRTTRREFLKGSAAVGAGILLGNSLSTPSHAAELLTRMQFGLVTYLWGQDWDLPTLIANCQKAGYAGVELRTGHAHKVESGLSAAERAEVKKRFADTGVILVGLGTNFAFHYPEADRLRKEIEGAKAYVKLSADCGGLGVKVKPNDLPKDIPQEKTVEQIGKSLNEIGKFAADCGQEVRLEVHGTCSQLPVIKSIMDVANHPNVRVCWNCNAEDLQGQGLESNFRLVRPLFSQTAHVRELNAGDYPDRKSVV
jgi:sugar phosphate isomerase/epimerase